MITFKQYLEEASNKPRKNVKKPWKVTEASTKKAAQFIATNCSDALSAIAKNQLIYRGFGSPPGNVVIMDSSKSLRMSRDTNNLYQLALETSSHVAHLPSRSKSFICTTDLRDTLEHGEPFVMIPVNGTPVAVSDTGDFHSADVKSWIYEGSARMTGDDFFGMLIEMTGSKIKTQYDDVNELNAIWASFSAFEMMSMTVVAGDKRLTTQLTPSMRQDAEKREKLDAILKLYEYNLTHGKISAARKNMLPYKDQLSNYFEVSKYAKRLIDLFEKNPDNKRFTLLAHELFNNKTINVKVGYIGNMKLNSESLECWFSGKCVAVNINTILPVLAELKKMGHKISPVLIREILDYSDSEEIQEFADENF